MQLTAIRSDTAVYFCGTDPTGDHGAHRTGVKLGNKPAHELTISSFKL